MAGRVWLGGIFLKHEGGYEIAIRALRHYRKRLKTLGRSPELSGAAAMFASVLSQEAARTVPKIDEAIGRIHGALHDGGQMESLRGDCGFLDKALSCYESDIRKALDAGNGYFAGLVGDADAARGDLALIERARKSIPMGACG